MTTIAADAAAGVMCSDSHWVDTEERGTARKVFRVRGKLIGLAGDLGACRDALAWFRGGCSEAPPTGIATALILEAGRLTTWDAVNGFIRLEEQKFAIGSGAKAARAAMLVGADCVRAVWAACQVDSGSSGRVRAYRVPTS